MNKQNRWIKVAIGLVLLILAYLIYRKIIVGDSKSFETALTERIQSIPKNLDNYYSLDSARLDSLKLKYEMGLIHQDELQQFEAIENMFIWTTHIVPGCQEIPYQVGIYGLEGPKLAFKGSGTILNESWIVTAAHVVKSLTEERAFIRSGSHLLNVGDRSKVDTIIIHEKYDSSNLFNDIALLKLENDLTFNSCIKAVYLPFDENDSSMVQAGRKTIISGWGRAKMGSYTSDTLRSDTVTILPHNFCHNQYAPHYSYNFVCAKGKEFVDHCSNDSGGPMIAVDSVDDVLVGIICKGRGCPNQKPGASTKVHKYINWIDSVCINCSQKRVILPLDQTTKDLVL